MSTHITAFQLSQNTMNGKTSMPSVYLDRRTAELIAEDLKEEWVGYTVKEVSVRKLSQTEGVVDDRVVDIIRTPAKDILKKRICRKLTREERSIIYFK